MTAKIIDGKAIAKKIRAQVAQQIQQRNQDGLNSIALAVILVGNDPASSTYVRHKQRACQEVGVGFELHKLTENINQAELLQLIKDLNQQPAIHGILLQLPLPAHLNTNDLLDHIDPAKDIDGFHPYNLGRLAQRRPLLRPCTPAGVMTLLATTEQDLSGQHAVVIGASNIVGRPMALELLLARCTTTICHRYTKNLSKQVADADILISAMGKVGVLQSEWIKPGAIVIDVGFNHLDNGHIVGDVDFSTARKRAGWITPVPGGVGPMTVATLLQNLLIAVDIQTQLKQ